MIPQVLRDELDERNRTMETQFHLIVTEAQMIDLSAGYVPNTVKGQCRTMLDWALEDERTAAAISAHGEHARRKKKQV